MSTLGTILKDKREEMGLSLEEISQKTEIQQRYLQALEDDNMDIIPGEYYIKEFVKKYASVLKLDGNKLLSEWSKQKLEEEVTETIPVLHKPEKTLEDVEETVVASSHEAVENVEAAIVPQAPLNKKRVGVAILLALLVLVGGSYAVTQLFGNNTAKVNTAQSETTRATSQTVTTTSTSETSQATSTETTTTTVETTIETTIETTQATTVAVTTVPETTLATRTPSPNGVADLYTQSSQAGSVVYGLGRTYAGYNGNYNFVVRASEPTWIRASVSGMTIYENLLPAGVPITITASQAASDVNFLIGISPAVSITMNDEAVYVPTDSRVLNLNVNLIK